MKTLVVGFPKWQMELVCFRFPIVTDTRWFGRVIWGLSGCFLVRASPVAANLPLRQRKMKIMATTLSV